MYVHVVAGGRCVSELCCVDDNEEVEQQCQHVMALLEQQFGDIF